VKSFLDTSDEANEARSMMSKISCPDGFKCTRLKGQSDSVCCPHLVDLVSSAANNEEEVETTTAEKQQSSEL
jgi:hypothetical protein